MDLWDDTKVVPPLVGPKSHSENHGRKPQLCSSSRNTGSDRRKENYETTFNLFRIVGAIALLTLAMGCATNGTQTTDLLTAAGFKLLPADTPKKQELLNTLPKGQLSVVTWKGKTFMCSRLLLPTRGTWGHRRNTKPTSNSGWPSKFPMIS